MEPRFGAHGWGHEQMALAQDDGVFHLAAQTANIVLPNDISPRAATVTFFATGNGAQGGDLCYVQHVQQFDWDTAERALLEKSIHALYSALAVDLHVAAVMGIDVADDDRAVAVNALASAMKVPAPPQTRWSAAVVALYVPNALNVVRICWGVVRDPAGCDYSTDELIANSYLLLRNLWRANLAQDSTQ